MKKLLLFSLVMLLALGAASCKSHKSHDDNSSKSELSDSKSKSEKDDAEDFKDAVYEYLEAIEFEKNYRQNVNESYSQQGFDPQEIQGMLDYVLGRLPDKMVPIYSKYFTADELRTLTKINLDEVFIKQRELQPQIDQDFMDEGEAFALGKPSPTASLMVSSDFDSAMREYMEADEYEKQIEQMIPMMVDIYDLDSDYFNEFCAAAPDMTVKIYSKYFSITDVKQLTALAKIPCFRKFRKNNAAIVEGMVNEAQNLAKEYEKDHPIQ